MNCAAASAVSLQRDAQAASKASRSARAHCMRASLRNAAPARVSPAARGRARSERCSVRGMTGYVHRFGLLHRFGLWEALRRFGASGPQRAKRTNKCPTSSQASFVQQCSKGSPLCHAARSRTAGTTDAKKSRGQKEASARKTLAIEIDTQSFVVVKQGILSLKQLDYHIAPPAAVPSWPPARSRGASPAARSAGRVPTAAASWWKTRTSARVFPARRRGYK